jgi:hypothetical protein
VICVSILDIVILLAISAGAIGGAGLPGGRGYAAIVKDGKGISSAYLGL